MYIYEDIKQYFAGEKKRELKMLQISMKNRGKQLESQLLPVVRFLNQMM